MKRIVYDLETYPNCFTAAFEDADSDQKWIFEISEFVDQSEQLLEFLRWLENNNIEIVGFNNIGFDYPILHLFILMGGASAGVMYNKCQAIINAQNNDRFLHQVYPSDRRIKQIDLFKIHHFDNRARATSLKALEFNMGLDNIKDLPFPPGTILKESQINLLKEYNAYDVYGTKKFYFETLEAIKFREELSTKLGKDVMNMSDVKIGKTIFEIELLKSGVGLYEYTDKGRTPKQTPRNSIALKDCIPNLVQFTTPEFCRIHDAMFNTTITETKGELKLSTVSHGLEFYFGTGGIHACVPPGQYTSDGTRMILDIDVTSLYPSIAIEYGCYPEHLGNKFTGVYRRLRSERLKYPKGSLENALYKLALNGVYGASGDPYSVFYDPLFTMRITITGQLLLAMLAEKLQQVESLEIIQVNTDGITMTVDRDKQLDVSIIMSAWEKLSLLTLESVEYKQMVIADVNNYIAVGVDGKVKRKGKYEYDVEWHKDHSQKVVAKVAERVLVYGKPLVDTLVNWSVFSDFLSRVKVPRSSKLYGETDGKQVLLENTQRYYVSMGGVNLVKVMPPLAKKPGVYRRFNVVSGYTVCPCNDINDSVLPINYDYYVNEVEKLVLGVI